MGENHPQIHERLRRIRWTLLGVRDRLTAESHNLAGHSLAARLVVIPALRVLQLLLSVAVYLLSFPIFLTRTPQTSFSLYARRRNDTYIDSYAKFKQTVQFTIGLLLVSIVAVALAVILGTFVRTKIFPDR